MRRSCRSARGPLRRARDRSPDWRGLCTGWEEQARRMRTPELDAERTDGGQEARTLLGSIRAVKVHLQSGTSPVGGRR